MATTDPDGTDYAALRARHFLNTPEAHVAGQHVVSKVVLRSFEEPVRGTPLIGVYSVAHGPRRPLGRSRAGLAPDLLTVATESAEELWAATEDALPLALGEVRRLGADASAASLAVLRDVVALHFARGKVSVDILNDSWSNHAPAVAQRLVGMHRDELTATFVARNSRMPTDEDLVALVFDYATESRELHESGAWARARTEQIFEQLRSERGPSFRVVVELADDGGSGFLISDSPAATCRSGVRGVTPQRVGWEAADEISMPLAPDLTVCLIRVSDATSPDDGALAAPAEAAESGAVTVVTASEVGLRTSMRVR